MTRTTDISSDLDTSKNNTNSTMLTGCFFNNTDPNNKKKLVFDCADNEKPILEILSTVLGKGKKWEPSD